MSSENSEPVYQHRGARALVRLHETHLREFLAVWREFVDAGAPLPESEDPDYESAEHLLRHVLGAAGHYLEWTCTRLGWKSPGVRPAPEVERVAELADEHLEHLLGLWRVSLTELTHEVCDLSSFESAWGPPYCIDAMLEHAVMHPIRHSYQLREILHGA